MSADTDISRADGARSAREQGQRGRSPDGGLRRRAAADALWQASFRSDDCRTRAKATLDYLVRGVRPEPIPALREPVEEIGATGICCSGGGIRSAAYNLGALQALQKADRLRGADYLAAVSGGSYIAAAYSMVAKTWKHGDTGPTTDSNPDLLDAQPPFSPGSPEEQYLRNRSSYMAPDASAKIFLTVRLALGLAINLVFLALPIVAVTILAGVAVYLPLYGSAMHAPAAAWWLPAVALGLGVLMAASCVLRNPRNDGVRRMSEIWCTRLFVGGALLAVVTLVLPLVAVTDLGGQTAAQTASGPTSGLGLGGVLAGVLACLRELCASPKGAATQVGRARGLLARLAPRARTTLMLAAAAVAGPLLVLTIAVAALRFVIDRHDGAVGGLGLTALALALIAAFGVLYRFADLTSWSLHPFYKRRLCTAFALKRIRPDEDPRTKHRDRLPQEQVDGIAIERAFDDHVRLSETALEGYPTLLVCAAANISDPGATAPGRRVTSFTFSAHTIGGPLVGALETQSFEEAFDGMRDGSTKRRQRDLTLPAAVAMSGAAIAPSSGKLGKRSLTFLLTLANMRLGVWVPNPRWVAGATLAERKRYRRPRPWYLLQELLGRNRIDARYLYVSDGGHYENLGLVELLRRGCTRIYCFDASGGSTFSALGDAVALARSELGVEIDVDPAMLMPSGTPQRAARNAICVPFRYRSGEAGVLVYARNVVAPGAPWDVQAHQLEDARFPHDSTIDQLYTDQKFESYRVLGERAGERAMKLMDGAAPATASDRGLARPGSSASPPSSGSSSSSSSTAWRFRAELERRVHSGGLPPVSRPAQVR